MANLQNLTAIDLGNNGIFGIIPSQMKHVKLLEHLILSSNQLTGTLPSEIGDLMEIQTLDLSDNSFTGEKIDTIICNLTEMKYFNISRNLFRGKVERLYNIVNLGEYSNEII